MHKISIQKKSDKSDLKNKKPGKTEFNRPAEIKRPVVFFI